MSRKTDAILSTITIVLMAIAIWGLFVYPADEAGEVRDKLGENFTFEIQCEVIQIDNNSALLYFTMELPENFSNEDNLVKAEIESVKSSFSHISGSVLHPDDKGSLYLGTKDNLLFVQNGSRLENYLIVPSGERLKVAIEIYTPIPIYGRLSYTLKDVTKEVIT